MKRRKSLRSLLTAQFRLNAMCGFHSTSSAAKTYEELKRPWRVACTHTEKGRERARASDIGEHGKRVSAYVKIETESVVKRKRESSSSARKNSSTNEERAHTENTMYESHNTMVHGKSVENTKIVCSALCVDSHIVQ